MRTSGDKIRRRVTVIALPAALLLVAFFGGPLTSLEIAGIRAYQRVGSPVTRQFIHCRFDPHCSAFALSALEKDGFWKGNSRIALRLLHCSPLGWLADKASR
jgi:putative membrane protein insertion efficiency factor